MKNLESKEDALLASRLGELASRALDRGSVEYTRFLDPREQTAAQLASRRQGVRLASQGDEGMERRVCAFDGRLWLEEGEARYDWPAVPLEILWDGRFDRLTHRDILGAILALGIGRDSVGDILVGEGRAVAWLMEGNAPYVAGHLISAGRAAVKVSILEGGVDGLPQAPVKAIRGSVHSLRLDAVVAEAFALSREEASRAVLSGLVKVDHAEESKPDRRVVEGALLSVRGIGRARLVKASEHTRRSGRVIVEFEKS